MTLLTAIFIVGLFLGLCLVFIQIIANHNEHELRKKIIRRRVEPTWVSSQTTTRIISPYESKRSTSSNNTDHYIATGYSGLENQVDYNPTADTYTHSHSYSDSCSSSSYDSGTSGGDTGYSGGGCD